MFVGIYTGAHREDRIINTYHTCYTQGNSGMMNHVRHVMQRKLRPDTGASMLSGG